MYQVKDALQVILKEWKTISKSVSSFLGNCNTLINKLYIGYILKEFRIYSQSHPGIWEGI